MSICVSFSGMQMYDQCPSSFKRRYITLEETAKDSGGNAAMARGSRIHKGCEEFLLDHAPLPDEAQSFAQFFTAIKEERDAEPEVKFAFNLDWEPTKFNDKETAQVRGILDIIHTDGETCFVTELKTGKKYPEHALQRSLYGLAGGLRHPNCSTIVVQTMYLDANKVDTTTFLSEQLPSYQWTWQRLINKVQPPQQYPQRPSWKCRFCNYHQEAGGTCNGERT